MSNNKELINKDKVTLDDFIKKIKELPAYNIFKKAVETDPDKEHAEFLEATVMLFSLSDESLSSMMLRVSTDLLFGLVSQKLTNEILGGAENETTTQES